MFESEDRTYTVALTPNGQRINVDPDGEGWRGKTLPPAIEVKRVGNRLINVVEHRAKAAERLERMRRSRPA